MHPTFTCARRSRVYRGRRGAAGGRRVEDAAPLRRHGGRMGAARPLRGTRTPRLVCECTCAHWHGHARIHAHSHVHRHAHAHVHMHAHAHERMRERNCMCVRCPARALLVDGAGRMDGMLGGEVMLQHDAVSPSNSVQAETEEIEHFRCDHCEYTTYSKHGLSVHMVYRHRKQQQLDISHEEVSIVSSEYHVRY